MLILIIASGDANGDPMNMRLQELLYRLSRENAIANGARNMIRIMQLNKPTDKRAMQDVRVSFSANIASLGTHREISYGLFSKCSGSIFKLC